MRKAETSETIGFFVTFLSLVAFQLGPPMTMPIDKGELDFFTAFQISVQNVTE